MVKELLAECIYLFSGLLAYKYNQPGKETLVQSIVLNHCISDSFYKKYAFKYAAILEKKFYDIQDRDARIALAKEIIRLYNYFSSLLDSEENQEIFERQEEINQINCSHERIIQKDTGTWFDPNVSFYEYYAIQMHLMFVLLHMLTIDRCSSFNIDYPALDKQETYIMENALEKCLRDSPEIETVSQTQTESRLDVILQSSTEPLTNKKRDYLGVIIPKTFKDLFKDPYNSDAKLDEFKRILFDREFIDKNGKWMGETKKYVELALLYRHLEGKKNILQNMHFDKGIVVFYREFGMTVAKKKEPDVDCTIRGLRKSKDKHIDENNLVIKIFAAWVQAKK